MTAPLPPQTPEVPPRYRFRPRFDKDWRAPTFRTPLTPRVVLPPTETYDPDGEARPFEWSELRDWHVWAGGLVVFVGIAVAVVAASVVGWAP